MTCAGARWLTAGALALGLATCACSGAEAERQARADKADLHCKLATNYWHAGNIELAVRELVEALNADEAHPDAHYLYGVIFFGQKNFDEATEHFRRALAGRANFFAARNILGVTYMELERWPEAIQTLTPLLKEPTYTTQYLTYNNLGWAHARSGDLRQADKHLRMAVFLNPKMCNAWRNLGLVAMQQRDFRAAVEDFTEATTRCPNYAELHLQRAEALDADGQATAADQALRKCADLAGDTALGRRCRSHMRSGGAAGGGVHAAL